MTDEVYFWCECGYRIRVMLVNGSAVMVECPACGKQFEVQAEGGEE